MTRLYNRETLGVVLIGLLLVVLISLLADLGRTMLFFITAWLVISLPVAMKVQYGILPLYLRLGFLNRALNLAVDIRESAPNRKSRDLASVDISMVQAMMGRFEDALKTLKSVKEESFGNLPKAYILANRAWCRAHLDKDLELAMKEAQKARELAPDEGLMTYFEGLVLFRKKDFETARKIIAESLEKDKDPLLPAPGERSYILGEISNALNDSENAIAQWKKAYKESKGRGPFASAIADRIRS